MSKLEVLCVTMHQKDFSKIREMNINADVVFANQAKTILNYTDCIINCDIHTRARSKRLLKAAGAEKVFGLDEIMTESVDGSGWNARYSSSTLAAEEGRKSLICARIRLPSASRGS